MWVCNTRKFNISPATVERLIHIHKMDPTLREILQERDMCEMFSGTRLPEGVSFGNNFSTSCAKNNFRMFDSELAM